MQKHPQLKFVVKNPDGSVQLAWQPSVKDVNLVDCRNCHKINTVKGKSKIECSNCGTAISQNICK